MNIEVLESEIKRLQNIIERDRSRVAIGLTKLKSAISGRYWSTESGRGCYEWDDDKWRDEFGAAISEIQLALESLERVAKDWSDCPTDPIEIQKARKELLI